ncbi:MOSC N-terminal beta barrel domain-containing protein [Nocardioides sp. 1609]|uniref:MOSC domain-containing protein n=1 Tax=Nocardioides sp. 1609 TaxID=2508327 RepID=UPI001ADB29E8|nr:MOSC N-terminal beta barrel domain-containing protein [Nocardioides sp. 1609]
MPISVTSLRRYPVKSCRGEELPTATVRPWGLDGDRRWMLVDDTGAAITAREVNRLLLVHPQLTGTGLRVEAPGGGAGGVAPAPLEVATPDPGRQVPVSLWSSRFTAAPAGAEADAWFSEVLGTGARLVHLDDPTRRPTTPNYGDEGDVVSLADGYPLLLTTEESLAAVNDQVLASAPHGREPLPMTRFRPNVVVAGAAAWREDDWRRIRIGDVVLRAVKGCARCVITTIDPDTAVREKQPVAAMARIRRFDNKTWFGTNLVPDLPVGAGGVRLRVGDEVEVLDAVEPGAGPLRVPTRNAVAEAH